MDSEIDKCRNTNYTVTAVDPTETLTTLTVTVGIAASEAARTDSYSRALAAMTKQAWRAT